MTLHSLVTQCKFDRNDFTEWRLDHNVALQCHRCDTIFTIHHVGRTNMITDLIKHKSFP